MIPQADIIYQPISGKYSEKHFEVPKQDFGVQSWTWVLFSKSVSTEWVASFRGGGTDMREVATFNGTPFAFVVSDGQGYFVNVETEELIKFTIQDTIKEIINVPDSSLMVFVDDCDVFTVNKSLTVEDLELPFEFYSVRLKKVSGGILAIEYEEMYSGEFKEAYLDIGCKNVQP